MGSTSTNQKKQLSLTQVSLPTLPARFRNTWSAYHTTRLSILHDVKDAYLSLELILAVIILPKWNFFIGGGDTNPVFYSSRYQDISYGFSVRLRIYQLGHYIFFRNVSQRLFSRTLQWLHIFVTLAVFNWNAVTAGWMKDAVLYIPPLTKMYFGGVILVSLLYHGILQPRRGLVTRH